MQLALQTVDKLQKLKSQPTISRVQQSITETGYAQPTLSPAQTLVMADVPPPERSPGSQALKNDSGPAYKGFAMNRRFAVRVNGTPHPPLERQQYHSLLTYVEPHAGESRRSDYSLTMLSSLGRSCHS
jgi:hypothetical protein